MYAGTRTVLFIQGNPEREQSMGSAWPQPPVQWTFGACWKAMGWAERKWEDSNIPFFPIFYLLQLYAGAWRGARGKSSRRKKLSREIYPYSNGIISRDYIFNHQSGHVAHTSS